MAAINQVPDRANAKPLVSFEFIKDIKKMGCLDEECTYAGQKGTGTVCVCVGWGLGTGCWVVGDGYWEWGQMNLRGLGQSCRLRGAHPRSWRLG